MMEESNDPLSITDPDLVDSLKEIEKAVTSIWSGPIIIKDYPEHKIDHSSRVIKYISQLLNLDGAKQLNERERYLLLASTYLHDIGMQCDIIQFPEILKKAESLGAKFYINFHAKKSSNFHPMEQIELRNNHHYLSAAWISCAFVNSDTNNESALDNAAKTVPSDLLKCLMYICIHHRELKDNNIPPGLECDVSYPKDYLSDLLRFADELDIGSDRVPEAMYKSFRFSQDNIKYWWLHEHTDINIENNTVNLSVKLDPEDEIEYSSVIQSTWINEFRTKNKPLLQDLKCYGIKLTIDGSIKLQKQKKTITSKIGESLKYKRPSANPNIDNIDMFKSWSCNHQHLKNGNNYYVLTNGESCIHIHIIKFEGDEIDWNRESHEINSGIGSFYMKYILNILNRKDEKYSRGTGILLRSPCGYQYLIKDVENPFFATNKETEWIIAWTKRSYKEYIVGVHALLGSNSPSDLVYVGGGTLNKKYMPVTLTKILSQFRVDVT
ncbi:MAG TPA: hypothetical protein P5049_03580 [Methanothrix sp.]|nr:hypothetical protein [Methanothrix sp.]